MFLFFMTEFLNCFIINHRICSKNKLLKLQNHLICKNTGYKLLVFFCSVVKLILAYLVINGP